jgi:hypothetical protein
VKITTAVKWIMSRTTRDGKRNIRYEYTMARPGSTLTSWMMGHWDAGKRVVWCDDQ